MQQPMFPPSSDWRPPNLSELPKWSDHKRICLDVETCDPGLGLRGAKALGIGTRRDGYVVGVSVTIDGGPSFYLPFRHKGGDNLDEAQCLAYLRQNAQHFKGEIVGANLSYDLDYLWQEGIKSPHAKYLDVLTADVLIDESHFSYSLKNVGARYGIESKNEDELRAAAVDYNVDPKAGLWQLPARFVGAYAETDTQSPLAILREQEKLIEKYDLHDIWRLESEVLPVLVKLRRRGVKIDLDQLEKVENYSKSEEATALKTVKDLTGVGIGVGNIWKAEALKPALEAIGITVGKTATGKPNIDKEVLGSIDHPVGEALAWARKVNKLRSTFAESVRYHMVCGRIHPTFNQIARESETGDMKGARYGRLSCILPNLQQQPSRDKFAKMWRSIYIPETGAIWGCTDYAQQEPKWVTDYAANLGLPKAVETAQAYCEDPNKDNHQMMSDLTGLPRKQAKDIYQGLSYGEGGAKLCTDLGLPTRWAVSANRKIKFFERHYEALAYKESLNTKNFMWKAAGVEGQRIIDKFNKEVPFVKGLAKRVSERAGIKGVIRTKGGRLLHFPEKAGGGYNWTHKALNRLIQGTAADQMKQALVNIDREMPDSFVQLQVHDELDGSYGSVREIEQVADMMRNSIPNTRLPFAVDVEHGPSWGEAE